jgi:flagella basal body P-ring formation protein FlgA
MECDTNTTYAMSQFAKAVVLLCALSFASGAYSQEQTQRQSIESLRQTVEQFLHTQSAGLPGTVTIAVGSIDPRTNLTACAAPQAYLPHSARVWGKTTVGVRCSVPTNWNVYISATVRVQGEYVATAAPLAQGQSIEPADLVKLNGDLTALPPGIIMNPEQAIGRTLAMSLLPGTPLRQDALRSQQAILQGQAVRVVSNGPGFQVSAEAKALKNANDGQVTQVRATNGQVLSGIARIGGVVEVN